MSNVVVEGEDGGCWRKRDREGGEPRKGADESVDHRCLMR